MSQFLTKNKHPDLWWHHNCRNGLFAFTLFNVLLSWRFMEEIGYMCCWQSPDGPPLVIEMFVSFYPYLHPRWLPSMSRVLKRTIENKNKIFWKVLFRHDHCMGATPNIGTRTSTSMNCYRTLNLVLVLLVPSLVYGNNSILFFLRGTSPSTNIWCCSHKVMMSVV